MPITTHDRSKDTHDFEFVDLREASQIDLVQDDKGKVWINLNGKCLLRVGKCDHVVISRPDYVG